MHKDTLNAKYKFYIMKNRFYVVCELDSIVDEPKVENMPIIFETFNTSTLRPISFYDTLLTSKASM